MTPDLAAAPMAPQDHRELSDARGDLRVARLRLDATTAEEHEAHYHPVACMPACKNANVFKSMTRRWISITR
jgi:hypothetical protein